ncbi:porin [Candidatus Saccharibacteria bacterium]|nr:porin [Candidatus Saccharibacteria bacterium]
MKKSLVAAAVSAAVMLPVGAQAEMTVYGRINNALVLEEGNPESQRGSDSTTDISGIGSRFGVKASSDLGNGLTAHGRYEFGTTTDNGSGGITSTRIATAGISGGFGRVDVGNQWSAFYNTVGVDIDPTYAIGPVGGTPFRSPNTVKYSNSVGPLTLEADLRLDDTNSEAGKLSGNGGGIGVRVAATDSLTIAAAFDMDDQTDKVMTTPVSFNLDGSVDEEGSRKNGNEHGRAGLSAKLSMGQFWGSLGWSSHEEETGAGATVSDSEYMALYVGASLTDSTSGWIGYSQSEKEGSAAKPSKIAAGLYHNMGGGLRLWYEGGSKDPDEAGKEDHVKHLVGIRYDF